MKETKKERKRLYEESFIDQLTWTLGTAKVCTGVLNNRELPLES